MTVLSSALADALCDRYTIERELGRGGMATVYLARDLKHERLIALKVLHPGFATAAAWERFHREIRVAASLQHPHILTVHDSGQAAGHLWYTMPYVEGESLRDRLRRETQLGLDEALSLIRDVADALEYAHERGIVHRDIKPENILLARGHAFVADFGIARALDPSTGSLTGTGLVVGTPHYMSPEQATGDNGAVDGRSDIYSLGCVLYELLAGKPPFSGTTPLAILARRITESPPDLRQVRPVVPAGIAEAVQRAMARLPEDRFASVAGFSAALQAFNSTLSNGQRRTWPRRLAGVAVIAICAIAVGTAASQWLRARSTAISGLDANLLAVAPFDALGSPLQLWREGLVDVLSRSLDGAGALRTVAPTVVVRRWSGGHADQTSAAELARATGAGLVLYGGVVPAGADSVRLTAAVFDARRRALRTEVDLRGSAGRMDRVIDSLAVAVLRALAPPGALASSAGTPLGTTSYPALKAFLKGEQYYRQSEFDSARTTFRRAVMLDSSFALAWHRLSQSTHWQDSTEDFDQLDPEIIAASFRAAGIRHVSAHDSLLVSADSVFWALPELMPGLDEKFWSAHSRLFGTLEEAQKRFPTDPDLALALAEAGWQWGGFSGRPLQSTLANYDRAIALDSAFTPAYVHALFIALGLGAPAQALVYLDACLRRTHSGATRETLQLIRALLGATPEDRVSADRLMHSLPPHALSHAFGLLAMSADSGETVIRLLRAALARRDADLSSWHGPLGLALGSRGHVREAYRELSHNSEWDWYSTSDPLLQDFLPPETFRSYLALWAQSDKPWRVLPPPLRRLADTGDTVTLKHLVRRNVHLRPETRAFLALGRRDTARAVAQFLALPDSTILWSWDTRLTKAQLLRSTGHLREAAEALRRPFRPEGSNYMPGDGLWALERGRVYEQLGQRAAAGRGYQTVVDLWRHPDPELQPMVNEARQALRRLGQEPH